MSAKQFLDLTGLGVLAEYIPQEIGDLSDVVIANIQSGQILKWNATSGQFENADESGGDPVFIGTKEAWNALTTQQKAVYDGCIVNLINDYDVQVKIDDTTPASNKVYSSQKVENTFAKTTDLPVWTSGVTALTGATTATIQDTSITTNSAIEVFASVQGLADPEKTITAGQCVLTFGALAQDTTFKLLIWN